MREKKLKKSNCDKTQIVTVVLVTVVTVAEVTVVIVTSFSKNKLTPRQPMRCSQGSFLLFSLCFVSVQLYDRFMSVS